MGLTVSITEETMILINQARAIIINKYPEKNPSNNQVINESLKEFVGENNGKSSKL